MRRPDLGLLRLTLVVVGGRRFWVLPFAPLAWLVFQAVVLLIDGEPFSPDDAQGLLIPPMTLLAVFLGIRIIAGEIDGRSLEIVYTVPGGCERVWWAKLLASTLILLAAEGLLAVATVAFFTTFHWVALYGALQGALFYLVVAMGMATLFRSEAAGAMGVAAILALNLTINSRFSPFWNPLRDPDADPTELLAWTLQNRIGIVLAMAAIVALAFMRANRRERMLS